MLLRRATIKVDELELMKFVVREELEAIAKLNESEVSMIGELRTMLAAEDLDESKIGEIRALVDELKDTV